MKRHRSEITPSWDKKGNSFFHEVSESEKIQNGLENLQKLSAESLPESRAKHAEKLLLLSSLMAPYRIKLSFIAKLLKLDEKETKDILSLLQSLSLTKCSREFTYYQIFKLPEKILEDWHSKEEALKEAMNLITELTNLLEDDDLAVYINQLLILNHLSHLISFLITQKMDPVTEMSLAPIMSRVVGIFMQFDEEEDWGIALSYYEKLVTIYEAAYGKHSLALGKVQHDLATVYAQFMNTEQQEKLLLAAFENYQTCSTLTSETENSASIEIMLDLVELYQSSSRLKAAEDLLKKVINIYKLHPFEGISENATFALQQLALIYAKKGEHERQKVLLTEFIEILEKTFKTEANEHLGLLTHDLALCYELLKDTESATFYMQRAHSILTTSLGDRAESTVRTKEKLDQY
ncbi:MAG TPA: hypothetical protein VD770_03070, partial [Coxiellaceae bacterium]|nr:hypothetical protein [Coxiellaceae bacterium]